MSSINDQLIAYLREVLAWRDVNGKPEDARAILALLCGYAQGCHRELASELNAWLEASRPYVEGSIR